MKLSGSRIIAQLILRRRFASTVGTSKTADVEKTDEFKEEPEKPWDDPYKHVMPEQKATYTDYREVNVDWDYVKRLLPQKIVPGIKSTSAVTPSGWRAPKEITADLPYYIRRASNHMLEIYLERRRDELNPKTMDFEYVELVVLKNIQGDIFACERDMRAYLENRLGHPIATSVDELKGLIKVKGADRTLVEQFVYDYESEFKLCPQD